MGEAASEKREVWHDLLGQVERQAVDDDDDDSRALSGILHSLLLSEAASREAIPVVG
jgi:hypothetical protein